MIYEANRDQSVEDAAIAAVQAKCRKFRHGSDIYEIQFSCRKVEKIEMTDDEATRQFGNK